ncbi:YdeI/OmpD-associated family protein [Streptomyces sp. NPDC001890]|uniref:YdeI/OmpD-associated family protein n=1 Tax=Streptomyces sp. NPDC001890 TaxID=3364620 RepID=UPI00368F1483
MQQRPGNSPVPGRCDVVLVRGGACAFEALDRSGRYQLILPLLRALTPENRKARLDKALHRLAHTDPPQ